MNDKDKILNIHLKIHLVDNISEINYLLYQILILKFVNYDFNLILKIEN
jgi:hypothetical protein